MRVSLRSLLLLVALLFSPLIVSPTGAIWLETYISMDACKAATSADDAMRSLGDVANGTSCLFDPVQSVSYQVACSGDAQNAYFAVYAATNTSAKTCETTPLDSAKGQTGVCQALSGGTAVRVSCTRPLPLQDQAVAQQVFADNTCTAKPIEDVDGAIVYTGTSSDCYLYQGIARKNFYALAADSETGVDTQVIYQYQYGDTECSRMDLWEIQLPFTLGSDSCVARDWVGDGRILFVRTELPANRTGLLPPPMAFPPPSGTEIVYTCGAEDCSSQCSVLSYVHKGFCFSDSEASNLQTLTADGGAATVSFFAQANCSGPVHKTNVEPLGVEHCYDHFWHSSTGGPIPDQQRSTPLPLGDAVYAQFDLSTACNPKASVEYIFHETDLCNSEFIYKANSTNVDVQQFSDLQCATSVASGSFAAGQCTPDSPTDSSVQWLTRTQQGMQGSALAKLAGWTYPEQQQEDGGRDTVAQVQDESMIVHPHPVAPWQTFRSASESPMLRSHLGRTWAQPRHSAVVRLDEEQTGSDLTSSL